MTEQANSTRGVEPLGVSLVADPQPPKATKPGPGPLDSPAVATQSLRGLDHAAGNAGSDATPAQVGVAAPMIVGLVSMDLARPALPTAGRHADRWDILQHGLEHGGVMALAELMITEIGSPPRSPARCSLDPALPRSTGFAPVKSPLYRPQAEGVEVDPPKVDPAGRTQLVQQQHLELVEHPSFGPLIQPPPAGGRRTAAQFLGRQQAPRGGGAGHEDQRAHTVAVGDPARDPTPGPRWWGQQ
jgi:hypothetical protein